MSKHVRIGSLHLAVVASPPERHATVRAWR